jgi:DNA (cytosine-5)-methyltransferase 1
MLPKIIDLFSGCGGLTLGFEKAGFDIVAGIELMPEACKTISYNLDYRYGREQTHICGDITEIDAGVFKDRFGDEGCIVIGGPPCQAYSMAGRGKLKSLGDDRINTNDARGYLYQDFLRFVYDLDAKAVVMENVPESTNFGDMNIPEIVCDSLEKHGYKAYWTILNAADFGVPQLRERVIVFGLKESEQSEINLPIPTHRCDTDYQTQCQKRFESFNKNEHFKMPMTPDDTCEAWVTVGDAFSDLPSLFPTAESKYRAVNLNEEMEYASEPQNSYQKLMRNWYGIESFGASANAFRNNKRDFSIFERMKQGDNFTVAAQIADELFEKEAKIFNYEPGSDNYKKLKKKMVPVYDRDKFENKWKRLEESKPSHTLVAHLCKDTYSHIHPTEPRGISVREAARIQSFPDDFFFDCSMGDAYKQIGNAVPPLMAYAVAKSVYGAFEGAKDESN